LSLKSTITSLFLMFSVFFLAFRIDSEYHAGGVSSHGIGSFIDKVLGETRNIVSNIAFAQADNYFHRGVTLPHGESCDQFHNSVDANGTTDDIHAKTQSGSIRKSRVDVDPLLKISKGLSIEAHSHLGTEDLKEILPWLYYANKIDPGNISIYTVTAYYLADRFGRVEEAVSFLRKGIANNPDSWELYADMGTLFYENLHDYVSAARSLERARHLLEASDHDKFDERKVLTPLAYSYLELGEETKALETMVRILELFPEAETLRSRVRDIRSSIGSK